jgi:hypothetical protein
MKWCISAPAVRLSLGVRDTQSPTSFLTRTGEPPFGFGDRLDAFQRCTHVGQIGAVAFSASKV